MLHFALDVFFLGWRLHWQHWMWSWQRARVYQLGLGWPVLWALLGIIWVNQRPLLAWVPSWSPFSTQSFKRVEAALDWLRDEFVECRYFACQPSHISYCLGVFIFAIAFILWRLASMPLCDTRYPNNFPWLTQKMHFSKLRWRAIFCARSAWRSCLFSYTCTQIFKGVGQECPT